MVGAKLGWKYLPVLSDSKRPAVPRWQQQSTNNKKQLEAWAAKGYDFGLDCGASGLIVIDLDKKHVTQDILRDSSVIANWLVAASKGVFCSTPGGGLHLYFKQPSTQNPLRNLKLNKTFGHAQPWIETRGDGGYVVAYQLKKIVAPQDLPKPIYHRIVNPRTRYIVLDELNEAILLRKAVFDLQQVPQGTRNDALNRTAYYLASSGLEAKTIYSELSKCALKIGLSEGEVQATLSSSIAAGQKVAKVGKDSGEPEPLHRQLLALNPNVQFINQPGGRGSMPAGEWVEWNALHWELLPQYEIANRARILADIENASPDKIKRAVQAAEYLARLETGKSVSTDWNNSPDSLLDAQGRLFSLSKGVYVPPDQDNLLYRKINATVADSTSKAWAECLARWTNDDKALQAYLQRLAGYALHPANAEQVFVFMYGHGANGKSTFLDVLTGLLGDYAMVMDCAPFVQSRQQRRDTKNELAAIEGKRLLIIRELPQSARWDEALIKNITGEQVIQVRRLYGEAYSIMVQALPIAYGNDKPRFYDNSDGWRRRLHFVPWRVQIPQDERIGNYATQLIKNEGAKIMRWVVEGYKDWKQYGLLPPDSVVQATKQYLADYGSDIHQFLDDKVEKHEGGKLPITDMALLYDEWRELQGEAIVERSKTSPKRFRMWLENAGLDVLRGYTGGKKYLRYYVANVRLKAD